MMIDKRLAELMVCAIEQGYFLKMENKIYIDLLTVFRLKEILKDE